MTKLEGRTSIGVYTVGHSNHSLESFLSVLKDYGITAIADVRSYPYSNANPHFDREALSKNLEKQGIAYAFLGPFQEGLRRVQRGATKYRIALMCAEGEPLDCHRTILVSRYLSEMNCTVRHILRDGTLEDHDATMERLLGALKLSENLVLRNKREVLSEGYRIQGQRIAYELPKTEEQKHHLSFTSKGR